MKSKMFGGGGGDSSYFPIVCHYFMKLYECFQMKVMVSFDEIWPIIMPQFWNEIKDDWVHYYWPRRMNFIVSLCVWGGEGVLDITSYGIWNECFNKIQILSWGGVEGVWFYFKSYLNKVFCWLSFISGFILITLIKVLDMPFYPIRINMDHPFYHFRMNSVQRTGNC